MIRKIFSTCNFFILTIIALNAPTLAFAEWEPLPESRQHLYQTYANFVDQHNMLAWRGSNHYWGTLNANIPLVGNNESALHPQMILHFSGNDAMHVSESGGVFTETLDTRIGFDFQATLPFAENLRVSIGFQHESGHTVDGTDDPRLHQLNLGDNTWRIWISKDFIEKIRIALLLAPVQNSIPPKYPSLVTLMADYFPLGASEDARAFRPYVSSSVTRRLDFSGDKYTFQAQAGIAVGSHFQDRHTHDLRFGVGFYVGADPRAKYAQYEFLRTSFGFVGMMANL